MEIGRTVSWINPNRTGGFEVGRRVGLADWHVICSDESLRNGQTRQWDCL